ncbi:hypothetical protein HZ994_04600 [Akkermansiaceae bacterium]|nr:hypothetical protein HZ994_04600 [Akkermansiaceae bacterium]
MPLVTVARDLSASALILCASANISQAEETFRSLSVGATPESAAFGFDGKLFVTLMGPKQEKGDGDGRVVMVDGDKVSVFTEGLSDPKGLVFFGGKLITADLILDEKTNSSSSRIPRPGCWFSSR